MDRKYNSKKRCLSEERVPIENFDTFSITNNNLFNKNILYKHRN